MSDKKRLSAADILKANDLQIKEVEVPEWDGYVFIKPLSAAEALEFAEAAKEKKSNAAVRLVVISVVDDEGNPLFTDADIEQLKKKSMRAVMTIQKAALKLNGLSDDDEVKAAKNA